MKVLIKNDFHSTEILFINLTRERDIKGKKGYEISKTSYLKIKNKLCADEGCACGITYKSPYQLHIDKNATGKIYYLLRK